MNFLGRRSGPGIIFLSRTGKPQRNSLEKNYSQGVDFLTSHGIINSTQVGRTDKFFRRMKVNEKESNRVGLLKRAGLMGAGAGGQGEPHF